MNTALALFPDFALILLGYALRRWMALGDHFWTGLEKLVYFVLFPALLFNAITRTPLSSAALPLIGVGATAMVGAMLLALLARPLFPLTPISFASQFQCAFRFNSYIGLAIAAKLHGAAGIAAMGLLAGGMVPLANLAAVWMLARHGETSVWRELVKNPLFLATVAALVWNLAGLHLPVPVGQFLGRLGEAAIALGLLAVGAALRVARHAGRNRARRGCLFSRGEAVCNAGHCLVCCPVDRAGRKSFRCGDRLCRATDGFLSLHSGPAHGRGRRTRRVADLRQHFAGHGDPTALAGLPCRLSL